MFWPSNFFDVLSYRPLPTRVSTAPSPPSKFKSSIQKFPNAHTLVHTTYTDQVEDKLIEDLKFNHDTELGR